MAYFCSWINLKENFMNYELWIILVFLFGYGAIVFEHSLKVDKSAIALIMAGLSWTIYTIGEYYSHEVFEALAHHLSEIAQILLFLIAAMTIVEVIDSHKAFDSIKSTIRTRNKVKLLWIISWVTFFLSSVLDNLTTAIVMVSLLRKIIDKREDRLFFAGLVIIASNAGGAFSPIGDVTTTMLWIGGQISAFNIIETVFLPSLVSLLLPLLYVSYLMRNDQDIPQIVQEEESEEKVKGTKRVFALGVLALLAAPIFKTLFHLPPYMGILFALGILWLSVDIIHRKSLVAEQYSTASALKKIDIASVLFFFGILATVACLQSMGTLNNFAEIAQKFVPNQDVMVILIGLLSAIFDNVPLVAATQGMYSLNEFPMDSKIWEFIAYTAGTGGSLLIIGSAAGVTVMGMEKISFAWYTKRISLIALLGYLGGAVAYLLVYAMLH